MGYPQSRKGFTLVELAVVLVIIGLIVGVVLVGRDLIKNAEIKSTVAALETHNLAVNAFRTRFVSLPGDILAVKAVTFGLPARSGLDGQGDGDGMIENVGSSGNRQGLGGETALFWRDLSETNMLGTMYTVATDAVVDSSGFAAPAILELNPYIPQLKLRDGTFVHLYTTGGTHFFQLAAFGGGAANGSITWADGLSPYEALGIDEKLDDGNPLQGTARPVTAVEVLDMGGAPSDTACVDNTLTPPSYNLTTAGYANALSCQLRARASF